MFPSPTLLHRFLVARWMACWLNVEVAAGGASLDSLRAVLAAAVKGGRVAALAAGTVRAEIRAAELVCACRRWTADVSTACSRLAVCSVLCMSRCDHVMHHVVSCDVSVPAVLTVTVFA
jgi:hypothetical protein